MTTYGQLLAARQGVEYAEHAWLTFSGTWAAPGTGYCSWVVQAARAAGAPVFEVPVISPWSFGFIGGPVDAPSYRQSVDIAVEWAIAWILAHPHQTFGLAGYSQGGEAASRVYLELRKGGRLHHLRHNYIGGFAIGNPCREENHTFPGGRDPGGSGISPLNLTDTDDLWNDYAEPGDIYTTTPQSEAGDIMRRFYQLATNLQLNDFGAFATAFVQNIIGLLMDMGGPRLLGQLNPAVFVPAVLMGVIAPLIDQDADMPEGVAAAAQAAVIGLRFVADQPPTADHISYEFRHATPGVTYIQHATVHVIGRCHAVPARAAA